jgi:hypothetical protein
MKGWLLILTLLPAAAPAAADKTAIAKLAAAKAAAGHLTINGSANFALTVSPATISFTGTNPSSAPVVAGSATASVTWSNPANGAGNWNLTVQSGGASFSNCSRVPVSAVTVTCSSATADKGGKGTCGAPFALSAAPRQVASGTQQPNTGNYSVTLTFTLADSWKYTAQTNPSCTLSLSYIATVP